MRERERDREKERELRCVDERKAMTRTLLLEINCTLGLMGKPKRIRNTGRPRGRPKRKTWLTEKRKKYIEAKKERKLHAKNETRGGNDIEEGEGVERNDGENLRSLTVRADDGGERKRGGREKRSAFVALGERF